MCGIACMVYGVFSLCLWVCRCGRVSVVCVVSVHMCGGCGICGNMFRCVVCMMGGV